MTMKTKSCKLWAAVYSDGRVGAIAVAAIPLVESVLDVIGVRRWLLVAVPDDKQKKGRKKVRVRVSRVGRKSKKSSLKRLLGYQGYSLG